MKHIKTIMFVTGLGLILIPDPATTAGGILLLLASFGVEQ